MEFQNTRNTPKDLTELITKAIEIATQAGNKANDKNIPTKIKEGLFNYQRDIQNIVDSLLKSKGKITKEQLDKLDEKTKEAKFKLLEAQSSNTFVKYGLYVGIAIFAFGTLYFLTRDKSQTNG